MSGRAKRIIELEKQIEIQQEALCNAKSMNTATVHAYLLDKLTDEWCKLNKKLTHAELLEMAIAKGY